MKKIASILALCACVILLVNMRPKSSGSHPSSTGAPGEDKMCTGSGCHLGAPKIHDLNVTSLIARDDEGDVRLAYSPGETLTLTLEIEKAGSSKFGFEITSLAGLDIPTGQLVASDAVNTHTHVSNDFPTRTYLTHTFEGTDEVEPGVGRWTFDWVAPATNVGYITFYYCTNATNSDGTATGDSLYYGQLQIYPMGTLAGDVDNDGTIGTGEILGDQDGNGVIDNGEICGDATGDGFIDVNEHTGDANGNGQIDGGEILGDIDGSGTIDGNEIWGDKNGNGIIDNEEIALQIMDVMNQKSTFHFYPNPATDQITVNTSKSTTVNIFNAATQLVVSKQVTNNEQINLDALPRGVYYLQTTGENTHRKLILK